MNSTGEYNWNPIVQGSYWERTLTCTEAGVITNLTGFTAQMDIRSGPYPDSTLYCTLTTTGSDGIVITGASGLITLFIDEADSALFTWTEGYYDLRLTETATGKVTVLLRGTFTVIPRITV